MLGAALGERVELGRGQRVVVDRRLETFEQTSSRSAPSCSITANLLSARRRFARSRSSETASKSRNGW